MKNIKLIHLIFLVLINIFFISCKNEDDKDPKPTPIATTTFIEGLKAYGDNQNGMPGQKLANPIRIRLINNNGEPQTNFQVKFEIVGGGGTVSNSIISTDQNGYAQTEWTLGNQGNQILNSTIENPQGQTIKGFPLVFNAFVMKSGIMVAGGTSPGNSLNQLINPFDVFVDGNGNIYVADGYNGRIQKWAPGATSGVTVAGGNGQGSAANQLFFPTGIVVDGGGNIFITDTQNNRIQKWAPHATSGITVAGGNGRGSGANQISNPRGISMDGSANIYVTDGYNNRIHKWAPNASNGIIVAGGNGKGNGSNQFDAPAGLFLNNSGDIFIADYGNHRIQKWVQ